MIKVPEILKQLQKFSSDIGNDNYLVQGGGGNTSVKHDGVLWVKASGKWLKNALHDRMFVPLDAKNVLKDIQRNINDPVTDHVLEDNGLRPSIETTLHVLKPHKIVAHYHSVRALSLAVRLDGKDLFSNLFSEISWEWVPYFLPGKKLSDAVSKKLASKPDVLVLQNHGIVVGGNDFESVNKLINKIESLLDFKTNNYNADFSIECIASIANMHSLSMPKYSEVHLLGVEPILFEWASKGVMYPDHAVFLGPVPAILESDDDISCVNQEYYARNAMYPKYYLVRGKGVLTCMDLSQGAEEMLLAQYRVLERIKPGSEVRFLEEQEVNEILNWDAEKFRQAIDIEQSEII